MVAHNRVEFDIQDAEGNLYNAGVSVRWISEQDLSSPQLYSDYANAAPIGNPFTVPSGNTRVQFYSPAGRYRLDLFVDGVWINARRDFPVGTTREVDLDALYAAGTVTTTMLANDAVSYAKIQDVGAGKLLGNPTGAPASPIEVAIAGSLTFSGNTLSAGMPRGGIAGCILSNNSGDPTNDIDIAAGACRSAANNFDIAVAAMTKRLDANWAPGTNQGMRNSAAAITNTTYHIFAVAKADGTQDIYAHTSASPSSALAALGAEPGGSLYAYARRIGSIMRVGGIIRTFLQWGDYFKWKTTGALDVNGTAATSPTNITLSVPVGIRVMAVLNVRAPFAGSSTVYIAPTDATDKTAAASTAPLGQIGNEASGTNADQKGQIMVLTDVSAQVSYDGTAAGSSFQVYTDGFYDARGKDD